MDFWPGTYSGAISITFDDGLQSHLRIAVPELNARGLKATFYLTPKDNIDQTNTTDSWLKSLEPWKDVQLAGHEIGNHTISHPCSLNNQLPWQEGKNLLTWDLNQIELDILKAQERIKQAFPGQKSNSFAYPCYETTFGRGINRQSYTPLIAKHFIAARTRGELRGDLANDPQFCDLHHLSSWNVERQSGAFMIGLVELALAHHRWGIFTIHGIQEGHLPIGDSDCIELLDHLRRRADVVWVAPVVEIASYIQNRLGSR